MFRQTQYRLYPPIGPCFEALAWLSEHDRIDLAHIEAVCLRQGTINTDWSGFIEGSHDHILNGADLDFWNERALYGDGKAQSYVRNEERRRIFDQEVAARQEELEAARRERKRESEQRTQAQLEWQERQRIIVEEAAAQQAIWEAEQRARQLERERIAQEQWEQENIRRIRSIAETSEQDLAHSKRLSEQLAHELKVAPERLALGLILRGKVWVHRNGTPGPQHLQTI